MLSVGIKCFQGKQGKRAGDRQNCLMSHDSITVSAQRRCRQRRWQQCHMYDCQPWCWHLLAVQVWGYTGSFCQGYWGELQQRTWASPSILYTRCCLHQQHVSRVTTSHNGVCWCLLVADLHLYSSLLLYYFNMLKNLTLHMILVYTNYIFFFSWILPSTVTTPLSLIITYVFVE